MKLAKLETCDACRRVSRTCVGCAWIVGAHRDEEALLCPACRVEVSDAIRRTFRDRTPAAVVTR